jgi:arsenate reductase
LVFPGVALYGFQIVLKIRIADFIFRGTLSLLMLTIYHNPRCKKSRAGLQYVTDKHMEFQVREYLKDPLTEAELTALVMKLHIKPAELIRTQEEVYRKELKGLHLNDEEWIKVMVENPRLIRRPIVEGKYKAVVGDPPENIDRLQATFSLSNRT